MENLLVLGFDGIVKVLVLNKDVGVGAVLLGLDNDLFDFSEVPELFPDIILYILFGVLYKIFYYFSVDVGDEQFPAHRNFVWVPFCVR